MGPDAEEQVLASAVESVNRAPGELFLERFGNRPPQAPVVDLQGRHAMTDDQRADASARRLDFGQLGHAKGGKGESDGPAWRVCCSAKYTLDWSASRHGFRGGRAWAGPLHNAGWQGWLNF